MGSRIRRTHPHRLTVSRPAAGAALSRWDVVDTGTLYDIPGRDVENMNSDYYSNDLTEDETLVFLETLSKVWAVTNNYWYPLKPINRDDVIAFKADEFENKFGFFELRKILINNLEIYEIREWLDKGKIVRFETFEPRYDGDGEGFWFQQDMKWMIYCSHENTISIGGQELVQSIKDNWKDWNQYIW
jgi:hypothetical protein